MKFFKILSILIFGGLCFGAGILWNKHKLLESGMYELKAPLTIASTENQKGLLPVGSVLYRYSYGPSIDTFLVFINTKDLDAFEPIVPEHRFMVSPMNGYIK
jgi:hypothetical protein